MTDESKKHNGLNTAVVVALVSIVTGLMSPMYVMLLGQAHTIESQQKDIADLRSKIIGPAAALTERVVGLRVAVTELDRTLQNEIAGLKNTTAAELRALDTKIQGEIAAADNESSGRHDVQGEKLRALERIVFGGKE